MDITPEQVFAARKALTKAIREGRIKRQPCIECGNPDVHGHHPDYLKPLEVIWLCPYHHVRAHDPTRQKYEQATMGPIFGVTKRQHQVLIFIRKFIKDHEYAPSYEEIAAGLGLTSLATVCKHVKALENRGHLVMRPKSGRSLSVPITKI